MVESANMQQRNQRETTDPPDSKSKKERAERYEWYVERKRAMDKHNERFRKDEATYKMTLNRLTLLVELTKYPILRLHKPGQRRVFFRRPKNSRDSWE